MRLTKGRVQIVEAPLHFGAELLSLRCKMQEGHFYFINDQYFIDFPDKCLMQNKETIAGVVHDRPSFLSFTDLSTGLQWMIPISSRVSKYRNIYNRKTANGKKCDTIAFGDVLGQERAFLIQNMCPITPEYIKNEYLDSVTRIPVRLSGNKEAEIIQKARKVLSLVKQKNMAFLIFPDVLTIERKLLGID
nr:MAG TPA: hypothetical protein [Caudoviricetes sp.]